MRVLVTCVSLSLAAAVLTGCGSFASEAGPSGVGRLTIPTPSPQPADFVSRVDNEWLALEPDSVTQYDATDGPPMVVTVGSETVRIAGVRTTQVRIDAGAASSVDYLAQDLAGNVWWFGHDGSDSWRAGEDGAQAGLAMAASPRRADGYRTAYVPGEDDLIATVTDAPDEPGESGGTVTVETTTGRDESVRTDTYRRGVGLVERVEGGVRWELRGDDR